MHYDISELVDRIYTGRLGATFAGGTSFVHARDFARGALLAFQKGRAGEAYIISGRDEDNLSYRQFMRLAARTAREAGRRVRGDFLVVPRWLALPAASLLEAFAPSSSLTSALAISGAMTHRFTSRKAKAELGYEPRCGLEQGVAECHAFLQGLRARGS